MSGIASGVLYLVSPLAAVTSPPTATDPVVVSVSVPGFASSLSTAGAPVFTHLPIVRPRIFRSLKDVVAEDIRRQIDAEPDAGTAQADLTAASDGVADTAVSLNDAVVAAHEERIASLRNRLEIARADRAAAVFLNDLRVRLHRAEAARGVALARAAIDLPSAPACRAENNVASCGSTRMAANMQLGPASVAEDEPAAKFGGTRRGVVVATQRATLRRTRDLVARNSDNGASGLLGSTGGASRQWPHTATRSAPPMAIGELARTSVSIGSAASRATARTASWRGVDASASAGLAQARRSLATARRALEANTNTAREPHSIAAPTFEIAGLWRWPGSDTWSLADQPHWA